MQLIWDKIEMHQLLKISPHIERVVKYNQL